MLRVAEILRKRRSRLRRPPQASQLMTCRARANILVAGHGSRPVTLKTCRMSAGARRYRKSDASTRGFMTGRAIRLTNVPAVVEYGVEASQRWKALHVRGRVADRANRA